MNSDAVAGAALGALVGCLLGFSTQSVVAGAIAAVLAIVGGFVGVAKPAALFADSTDIERNSRLISFGILATVCFLISYYVVINRYLEPTPSDLKASLVKAGYTDADAKAMIGAKHYGVIPESWKKLSP